MPQPTINPQPVPIEANYKTLVELQTGGDDSNPTWSDMGKCIENIDHAFEEITHDTSYYSDEGFGSTDVTGGQLVLALEGKVKPGDAVSDYLTDPEKIYGFSEKRQTRIRLTRGNEQIIWNVTLLSLGGKMGAATDPNTLSIEIKSNGKPSIGTVS